MDKERILPGDVRGERERNTWDYFGEKTLFVTNRDQITTFLNAHQKSVGVVITSAGIFNIPLAHHFISMRRGGGV